MVFDLTLVFSWISSISFRTRCFRTLGHLPLDFSRLIHLTSPMCTSNPGWLAIARAFTEPELMELQSVKDDSLAMSKTLIMVPWFSALRGQ